MTDGSLVNDLLIMLSAIGSAVAGVVCGWQMCAAKYSRTMSPTTLEGSDTISMPDATVSTAVDEDSKLGDLEKVEVKPVLFTDNASEFSEHHDAFASCYGEEPTGLSHFEVREVAERLCDMAKRITADVDAHDAQLSEVNSSLQVGKNVETVETVLASVERLMRANEVMQSQLRESRDRMIEQTVQIEQAERNANTDALTRVSNRRAFDRELGSWTGEKPGVLALLDIDFFKKFNDQHGHRAGDEVLRNVAHTLRRELDGHCMVARYGGEEFGLIFSNHQLEDVLDLIEKARVAVSLSPAIFEDNRFTVTCSLGVTRMVAGEPHADALQRADDGLYLAKDAGRHCGFCIDSKSLGERATPYKLSLPFVHDTPSTTAAPPGGEAPLVAKVQPSADDPVVSTSRRINQAALARIPDHETLGNSYQEFLQRLGKAPVKLSVLSVRVLDSEDLIETSKQDEPITRIAQLVDLLISFGRPVDRVGYYSEDTLLICMPGIDGVELTDRAHQLREAVAVQLQLSDSGVFVGQSSIEIGDTFERMIERAVEVHDCIGAP